MLNDSIRYVQDILTCDGIPLTEIAAKCGTPTYIYSLPRALNNYQRIKKAFSSLNSHIHYSAKANANLSILRALIEAGAGIDAVSAGEIHRALSAGAKPENIVFAGVGKTPEELRYAVEQGIGWFNVENVEELAMMNAFIEQSGRQPAWIALRLNPDVTANTHPYIATGHGGAKFGLTAETVQNILANRSQYPHLRFAGIHIHIGSQLHDIDATKQAVQKALNLIAPHPDIRTVNIGGGLPVAYKHDDELPPVEIFAETLTPILKDYTVLLEPGRSIIADAGLLMTRVLYVKRQAGQTVVIVDGSMAELLRPALYKAHHDIIPVHRTNGETQTVNVVGPVCETSDVLGHDVVLSSVKPGDLLAITTAGAYGMVMASNYNARPRPPEVVIEPDGKSWRIARKRETWDDLIQNERV